MNHRVSSIRFTLILSTLGAALLACGGGDNPPVVTDLLIDTSPVIRGQQANGRAKVHDDDGVDGMTIRFEIAGQGGEPFVIETPVAGANAWTQDAVVSLVFIMNPAAPAGDYRAQVVAIDAEMNASQPALKTFAVQ